MKQEKSFELISTADTSGNINDIRLLHHGKIIDISSITKVENLLNEQLDLDDVFNIIEGFLELAFQLGASKPPMQIDQPLTIALVPDFGARYKLIFIADPGSETQKQQELPQDIDVLKLDDNERNMLYHLLMNFPMQIVQKFLTKIWELKLDNSK